MAYEHIEFKAQCVDCGVVHWVKMPHGRYCPYCGGYMAVLRLTDEGG